VLLLLAADVNAAVVSAAAVDDVTMAMLKMTPYGSIYEQYRNHRRCQRPLHASFEGA
jgi:hypothetical protein